MKIYISATLRKFLGGTPQVEIPASCIRKAFAILLDLHPEAQNVFYDDNKKLRDFIQVYVNGKKLVIDTLWDTELPADTEILLLPAIAGGAPVEGMPRFG